MDKREKVISEIEEEIRLGEYWNEYCRMIDLRLLRDILALLEMADMEKVIKGLKCCAKWMKENDGNACNSCPYHSHFSFDDNNCIAMVNSDAIALLKEQEQKIFELEERLRLLEYGDQEAQNGVMMPAT